MANLEERGSRPLIRSRIRQGIRAGSHLYAIHAQLEAEFGNDNNRIGGLAPSVITRMLNQEANRQDVIDRIAARNKTERTNMHSLVGCGRGEIVQTRITISWFDEAAGRTRTFGHTTTLRNQGRIMDILNPAIREAVEEATNRGYTPPHITSSMIAGSTRYRIEYVECVGRA